MKRNRAEVLTIVMLILGLAGLGAYLFKPKKLDGESRRADKGKQTTEQVETSVAVAVAAEQAKGAKAAAIITEVAKANLAEPSSPNREYIDKDLTLALDLLPKADLVALLAAEKRHAAFVEGKLDAVEKLYGSAYTDNQALQKRAAIAETKADAAFNAKRESDNAISEAAAANLALSRRSAQQWFAIGILIVGFAIYRLHLVGPGALGKMAADIRGGGNALNALSNYTAPWLFARVQKAAKLNTELKDNSAPVVTTPTV